MDINTGQVIHWKSLKSICRCFLRLKINPTSNSRAFLKKNKHAHLNNPPKRIFPHFESELESSWCDEDMTDDEHWSGHTDGCDTDVTTTWQMTSTGHTDGCDTTVTTTAPEPGPERRGHCRAGAGVQGRGWARSHSSRVTHSDSGGNILPGNHAHCQLAWLKT